MPEVKNWQVSDLYLRFKVANGIEKKLKGKVPQNLLQETYMPRIKMECDVFQKVGISDYFLILHDMALWCRKNNIPTNYSRGSAGGCLASYLLDITMIDPIPCDLSFERFYNVGRMETRQLPDIDFDVSQKHRDRIISEYIIPTYGERFVSPIGTRGTLQSKGAVKDIGRVLSIPIDDTEAISQMMGMTRGKVEMMKEALEEKDGEAFSPRAQRLHEWRRRYPELFKYVLMIEEMETIRTTSVHAAGIIISPTPVGEYIPLTWNAKKQIACTGYDMYELKNTGAVKIDVLGIRNLDIVQETMERAGINEKYHDFVERIPTDDEKTWRHLQKGNGVGVFQFESPFMRRILSDAKPEKIADLSDITALGRPGPLDARIEITDAEINFLDTGDLPPYLKGKFKGGKNILNMIEVYVARKKGELKIRYAHPLLEPILNKTYGVLIFQEDVSKIATVLGGYTPAEADGLRKIMGSKLTEKIALEEPKFLGGCEKNGVDANIAMEIWRQMRTFAEYGFNKCLAAGTEVITPDGIKNIEDLTTEDHVLSLSTGSDILSIHSKPCWRKVVGVYPQGKQECVRVRTNCGAITHATKNHLFPTEHGFKMAEELSQRDCLFVSHFAPLCLTDEIDNGTAMLMGYVLGGKYNKNEDHHNLWFRDKQLPSMVRKDTNLRHKEGIFRLTGDMPDTKADLALDVSCFSEESLKLFLRSFCRASFMITIDPYCILPTERLCKQMQLAFLHYGILTSIAHRTKDDCFTLSLRGARSKLIFQDIFLGEMTNRQQRRWKAILHPSTCAEAYVRIDKVHSVYDVGALETYDIEVEGSREEEHVFFGDLILTHNSHSVGYSTLSYATAYMKTNHPAEFMASLISSDKDKEKRAQWIHEARDVLGLKVEAPNINSSELDFVANKNSIIYGLSEINGMGTVAVRAILEARKDGPFGSLEDFYDRVDLTAVNSARYRVLVLSGAMRDLHQNHAELLAWDEMLRNSRDKVKSKKKLRQENIAEYEEILRHQNTDDYVNKHITMAHKTQVEKGKKTMEEIRKEVAQKYLETIAAKLTKAKQELEEYSKPCTLPTSISLPNMSLEELMKAEEEVLGVQISGTIASPYVNEISMYSDTTIADVKDPEFDLKYWGNFCGVLTGIRESMVKNGKTKGEMMAFAKFTDLTGSIDLLIFPKAYSACKSFLLERKPICVRGKKSERGDSLIAFEISEV